MIPLPLLAVGLAGAATAAYMLTRKKDDAAPVPGGTPTMSPQMRQAFQALLAGNDPDAMETSAAALEPFGFLAEGAQLRAQAAQIRKARLGGVQPGPAPTPTAFNNQPVLVTPRPADLPPPVDAATDAVNQVIAQQEAARAAAAANGLLNQVNPSALPGGAALPVFAQVTTSSPAPEGDLMIRPAPNVPGIPGVGAEKNGIVLVVKQDAIGDGVWSQVVWSGGPRLGPAAGFVKSEFLRPSAVGPQGTATAGFGDERVLCLAPSGCRLRKAPSLAADFRAIVGNNEEVQISRVVRGEKLEAHSPGRGGWALVKYKNLQGWLPAEWLMKVSA